jgi:glycosyltransferase involved in cell wall biosynthesis
MMNRTLHLKRLEPSRQHSARISIGFVHHEDASDVRVWSGTPFFSRRTLHACVGDVLDVFPGPPVPVAARLRAAAQRRAAPSGGRMMPDHDPVSIRRYSRWAECGLREIRPDLIFSPASAKSLLKAQGLAPIVYFSDATFRAVLDYHPAFHRVHRRTVQAAESAERRVLQHAEVLLYASEWAAESARNDYGVAPERIECVGIGANLEAPPPRSVVRDRTLSSPLHMLFVARSWDWKGGPLAIEILRELNRRGMAAHLTIVGCRPSIEAEDATVVGFLNKQNAAEAAQLDRLWRSHHLLLFPTRAEAAGLVACEASAYGMPTFATRTGGVPSLVRDGVNGWLLPEEAGAAEWAEAIMSMVHRPDYGEICRRARTEFEERLNWDAWGRRVADILRERLPHLADRIGPAPEHAEARGGA